MKSSKPIEISINILLTKNEAFDIVESLLYIISEHEDTQSIWNILYDILEQLRKK